jgi:hypothetical protein
MLLAYAAIKTPVLFRRANPRLKAWLSLTDPTLNMIEYHQIQTLTMNTTSE